ncbi:TetR/AcrR family transcriptional regulator [Actinocatenispora sera]|uniref:TetR family transcriptional regulator n=1 Tax=Actinocatenispora sera TaxID=390989 RepID=A0A810L8K3_9ACTN|nr:TetR/AcrR family transcriptional regulator [Actinocatenispora sera]BCJ31864.1 TetR family transcriptional regulator [Actinocatenispora sera]
MKTEPRTRLVDCAVALLREEGVEAVTLRGIARRAGVTHNAPLRHFRNRATLLSAVAADGFRLLDQSLSATGTPAQRLEDAARGYVGFALANPHMFALMFRHDLVDAAEPALAAASRQVFDTMAGLVAERQSDGWRDGLDTRQLTGALWSSLHGFAQLWLYRALPTATGEPPLAAALDTLLRMLDLRVPTEHLLNRQHGARSAR